MKKTDEQLKKNKKASKIILTIFFIILAFFAIIAITQGGNNSSDSSETSEQSSPLDDIDFHTLYKNVPDDTTGNWRVITLADSTPIQDYALDYYNKFFKSDDEVHMIVNYNLHTTTSIISMSGMLFVNVYKYVDKEEHSAKTLCGGMHLGEYHVNIKTGEIEEIQ